MITNNTKQEICYLQALFEEPKALNLIDIALAVRKIATDKYTAPWLSRYPRSAKHLLAYLSEFEMVEPHANSEYKITNCGVKRLLSLNEQNTRVI